MAPSSHPPAPSAPSESSTSSARPTYTTLLLKTRSQPSDPYTSLSTPHFLPVLTHTLVPSAQAHLLTLLTTARPVNSPLPQTLGPYGGLILTSQRAVEALGTALSSLASRDDISTVRARLSELEIPVFVVGPATGKAVRELLAGWIPRVRIEGEDSGNGGVLAGEILRGYAARDGGWLGGRGEERGEGQKGKRLPLLFLVGEVRRDVIPRTLQSLDLPAHERVAVDEVVVYSTSEREEFAADFAAELADTETTGVRWVVVFSPTGCEAMLRILGWLDDEGRFVPERRKEGKGEGVYVASIGPTTRDYLRDAFGFEVDVCAEKPSPESVKDGIEEFMGRLQV